ncbi:MAG: hypothetical protein OdinLCB4_004345 [Candidatus Odinarchaeum yellowstonii]|uniref:4-vinyl reductase 4VR domain-containing protein n=1 Tax=Odinarchaeota yellowstonii (strain LCB_4) TaxID=1841599 RepID=A0AAF0D105_ODILC|nr:MAG: hypothetical protein OdinLCB4_004345 [Candidatus Odinarchaeum yellowstonii]
MFKKIDDSSLIALAQLLELDVDSGVLKVFNQRVGIFPLNSVLQLFEEIKKQINSKRFNEIIKIAGVKFGEGLLETILSLDKNDLIEFNPLQGREALSKILSFFGFGKIEYVTSLKNSTATLNYYNSPAEELDSNIFCLLIAGIIEGVLSRLYSKEVKVKEVKCVKRKDKYCSFKIFLS